MRSTEINHRQVPIFNKEIAVSEVFFFNETRENHALLGKSQTRECFGSYNSMSIYENIWRKWIVHYEVETKLFLVYKLTSPHSEENKTVPITRYKYFTKVETCSDSLLPMEIVGLQESWSDDTGDEILLSCRILDTSAPHYIFNSLSFIYFH